MKRILSVMLAAMLAVTLIVPMTCVKASADVSETFKIRTNIPEYDSAEGKAYYYTNDNVFYKYNYGPNKKYLKLRGGYVAGNCTWYAYGRASEILGKPLNTNFRWGANNWWSTNKIGNYYPYGSKPKVGAIACYKNHVAVVEKVVDDKVYVSESGWTISKKCPKKASDLKFHYGAPWKTSVKGYIYITDSISINAKDVEYSVEITADDLNLRAGPGTSYSRIGYATKGIYKVSQECGNWAKLAESGYWVCLTYAKIVSEDTVPEKDNNVSDESATGKDETEPAEGKKEPATTLYKVKVTASALNMRTGPGTSYKSKGTVKKNSTYEIKAEKNGWGQLKNNGYWIKLSYTKKVVSTTASIYKVKVKAKDLNMRTGPGTSYKRTGCIKPGTYVISKASNGWGKIKSNGYWIKLSYTTKI